MMDVRRAIAAIPLVLAFGGTAHAAGTLFAGPIQVGAGNDLECRIVNIDSVAHEVSIHIFDRDGMQVDEGTTSVAPLASFRDRSPDPAMTCRFTVDGSKKRFRATACAQQGGAAVACVAAQ
jgi:hypothetical protein